VLLNRCKLMRASISDGLKAIRLKPKCIEPKSDRFEYHHSVRRNVPSGATLKELSATHLHILKTPNLVSGIGALSAAEKHKARTRRVSAGVMMPSSHSRAVA
jgi:hypothetical protein